MQNFIVIGVFLTLGVLARRFLSLPERAPYFINQFIIFIALPAVILRQLPSLQLSSDALLPIVCPWIFFALTLLAVNKLADAKAWPRDVKGALLMLIPMGNTSYLGYPMVRAFFGEQGMPYAIMFDQIGNFLLLAFFAPIILSRFSTQQKGTQQTDTSWRAIVRRIVSFPPFIALCIALTLLRDTSLPAIADQTLLWLGQTMAPLAMFIIGLQLSPNVARELRSPLLFALQMKLVLSPLLALLMCMVAAHLWGGSPLAAQVTVLEAAMPTMVTAAILAMNGGLAPRLCTATVGFGLCCSLLTLPLWYAATQWALH